MKNINDKIESVEVIPMNKESIFGEPYSEDEYFNVTESFDEWLEFIEKISDSDIAFDVVTSGELLDIAKKAKGYMTGPVAKYGTHILSAKGRKFKTAKDLENVDWTKTFVYMFVKNHNINPDSSRYTFRYAEVE